jgi:hypothetical protein
VRGAWVRAVPLAEAGWSPARIPRAVPVIPACHGLTDFDLMRFRCLSRQTDTAACRSTRNRASSQSAYPGRAAQDRIVSHDRVS